MSGGAQGQGRRKSLGELPAESSPAFPVVSHVAEGLLSLGSRLVTSGARCGLRSKRGTSTKLVETELLQPNSHSGPSGVNEGRKGSCQ